MASRYQNGLSTRMESSWRILSSLLRSVVEHQLTPHRNCQVLRQHVPAESPLPVTEWSAWNIHARLTAQFQNILKRQYCRIGNGRQCGTGQVADTVIT